MEFLTYTAISYIVNHLLEKTEDKAYEKIGELIVKKGAEYVTWEKIRNFFIEDGEQNFIKDVENKTTLSESDSKNLNEKIISKIYQNNNNAIDLLTSFKLTNTDKLIAKNLLVEYAVNSIKLTNLYKDKSDVTNPILQGDINIKIRQVIDLLKEYEKDLQSMLELSKAKTFKQFNKPIQKPKNSSFKFNFKNILAFILLLAILYFGLNYLAIFKSQLNKNDTKEILRLKKTIKDYLKTPDRDDEIYRLTINKIDTLGNLAPNDPELNEFKYKVSKLKEE